MTNLRNINPYVQSVIVTVFMTLLTFTLALSLNWLTWDTLNWFEVAAVATSYGCTWLMYLQKRFSYIIAIVTTALYCVTFFQADLIASMILQVYLIPTVIFGYFRWKSDKNPKPVQKFRFKLLPVYILVVAAFYGGAVWVTNAFGGSMAPLDSAILIGTVLAQFLLDNKVLGNWWVWIVVDIISIYVYFSQGLYFAGVQYVFFLIGAFYGYYEWKRSYNNQRVITLDVQLNRPGALAAPLLIDTGVITTDVVRGGSMKGRKED